MVQLGAIIALAVAAVGQVSLEAKIQVRENPILGEAFPVQFAKSITGRPVTICLDGRTIRSSMAGKLGFIDQMGRTAGSYCAEVRAPVARGMVFSVRPISTRGWGGNIGKAGNIVAKHFRSAQTADQCAGLQLAIWEAVEDGGAKADFAGGRFAVRAGLDAIRYAEKFYEAIIENGDALYLERAEGGNGQNQITTRL